MTSNILNKKNEKLYNSYKQKYLQTKNIEDKKLYKKYKYLRKSEIMSGGSTLHCKSENVDECMKNINYMHRILVPYNKHRTLLQAVFIRDSIGIIDFAQKVLIEKFKFNFVAEKWDIKVPIEKIEDINNVDVIKQSKLPDEPIKFSKCIENLGDNMIYMIYLSFPGHANLLYINKETGNNYVYIYEPLEYKREIIKQQIEDIFKTNDFRFKPLPINILSQENLPLCFMYVLHFFIYLFVSESKNSKDINIYKYIKVEQTEADNLGDDYYILSFTHYILKLSYAYDLVNQFDYYVLTDNIYKIQEIIKNMAKNDTINNLISKVSSTQMVDILYNHFTNIKLNISSFMFMETDSQFKTKTSLYEILSYITKIKTLNDNQKCELYVISNLIVGLPEYLDQNKEVQNFKCTTYEFIDEKDIRDDDEFTALMYAIKKKICDNDTVKKLLNFGADMHFINKNGGTPLIYAIILKKTCLFDLFIEHYKTPSKPILYNDKNALQYANEALTKANKYDIDEFNKLIKFLEDKQNNK